MEKLQSLPCLCLCTLLILALVLTFIICRRRKSGLKDERKEREPEKKPDAPTAGASLSDGPDGQGIPPERFLPFVTEIIEENLSDPDFNVNALGEKIGMNQKSLYRKITRMTGMTTVEYIRTIRLKKAAMLLSDGKSSVPEVMYKVGFSNQSYFSRCFSKYFGVTPQQYRSGQTRAEGGKS